MPDKLDILGQRFFGDNFCQVILLASGRVRRQPGAFGFKDGISVQQKDFLTWIDVIAPKGEREDPS